MALSKNYREEYYQLLHDFVLLEALVKKYEEIEKEYKQLKKEIDEQLEKANSLCSDCERLLDAETGSLKANAQAIIGEETLNESLMRLSELSMQKKQIEREGGFQDGLYLKVISVVAIDEYEKMEKDIVAELGKEQGERIIYEEKKKAAEFEKTVGIFFFGDAVERMEEWFSIKVLYPTEEIELTKENNFLEKTLLLTNAYGEKIPFKKTAQTSYKGVVYLELITLQERKIRGLHYYTVEETDNGQRLVLLEDERIYEILYDLCEV